MKTEIKQRWLQELRSNKYKQGKGSLKTDDDKYCCLGILCELYVEDTKSGTWTSLGRTSEFRSGEGSISKSCGVLTKEVLEWAGLEDGRSDPILIISDEYKTRISAAELNDNLGLSFNEIADVIEGKPNEKVKEHLATK